MLPFGNRGPGLRWTPLNICVTEVETFHENHHTAVTFGIHWDPWRVHENGWRGSSLGVFSWGEIGNAQKSSCEPLFFVEKELEFWMDVFGMMLGKIQVYDIWLLLIKHFSSTVTPGCSIIVVNQAGNFFDLNRLIRSRNHQLQGGIQHNLPSLKLAKPQNPWKLMVGIQSCCFLLGLKGLFSGAFLLLVSGSVCHITPPKFNSSPLKNGGWKTSLSYWEGNFSGANC